MDTPQVAKKRLDVLDGLRGLAILLVFLNHVDSSYIIQALPSFLHPVFLFVFSSGTIGVSFFFVLSGFLMAYLYFNPQPINFIQKRYARIFPPFIAMVIAMTVFRNIPSIHLLLRIVIILVSALVVRSLWVVIHTNGLGKWVFRLFLLFQLGMVFWYGLVILRSPPIWFANLPFVLRESTISAVNATLTLPLGDYIPMLDGVYWSLIPEVLFYLIYPYLFVPIIHIVRKQKLFATILFLSSLFPYFFGLSLLLKQTRGLGMITIEYFIYFCAGIVLAQVVRNNKNERSLPFASIFFHPLSFFLLIGIYHYTLSHLQGIGNTIVRILFAVPLGLLTYGIIHEKTKLHSFFSSRLLIFFGIISYSMYICHTAIVDGMHLLFKPSSFSTNVLFLVSTAIVFFMISYLFYTIIETPYFMFKSKTNNPSSYSTRPFAFIVFYLFSLGLFFLTYSSKYNFFSQQYYYQQNDVILSTQLTSRKIRLTQTPFLISFQSNQDNLGVITIHLQYDFIPTKPTRQTNLENQPEKVLLMLKDKATGTVLGAQKGDPAQIGHSVSYPFGFPIIQDAKQKNYVLELSVEHMNESSYIYYIADQTFLTTTHQISKKELLTNPYRLAEHIISKIKAIRQNKEASLVFVLLLPFWLILLFLLVSKKNKDI